MPEGAIYVGRPTRWGNRFRVADARAELEALFVPATDRAARFLIVRAYRAEMQAILASTPDFLAPLRGHDLACWCRLDQLCHADGLLELANA